MFPRLLRTSDLSALVTTNKVTPTRRVTSTELSVASWLKVETLLLAMELVESQSMATSLLMKTSPADITREVCFLWLMLAQTLTVHNSSLLLLQLLGKYLNILSYHNNRLDGAHVVFGEMIEGENILRQLELVGTRNGNPTAKIVIEDCGEIKKEDNAAK